MFLYAVVALVLMQLKGEITYFVHLLIPPCILPEIQPWLSYVYIKKSFCINKEMFRNNTNIAQGHTFVSVLCLYCYFCYFVTYILVSYYLYSFVYMHISV